jgi:hypothetical protein
MKARPALDELADARGLEIGLTKRQMMQNPPEMKPLEVKGGGMAGLQRVVGRGKRKTEMESESEHESESDMEGGAGPYKKGKQLAHHLRKTHGKDFLDQFHEGLMKAAGGCSACVSVNGGRKPSHKVPGAECPPNKIPGAIQPISIGLAPYAPPGFPQNSIFVPVDKMNSAMRSDPGVRGATPLAKGVEGAAAPVKKMTAAERGRRVSELMRTKGMTLPEASRYLKEHH